MTVSAANPVGKWLDWSVQTEGDQTKTQINPAAETRIHAEFARQKPEPWHSRLKKLDRRAKRRQSDKDRVLRGECRLKLSFSICGATQRNSINDILTGSGNAAPQFARGFNKCQIK